MSASRKDRIIVVAASAVLFTGMGLVQSFGFTHGQAPVLTDLSYTPVDAYNGTFTATWDTTAGKPTKYTFTVYPAGGGSSGQNGKFAASENRVGTKLFYSGCPSGHAELVVTNAYGSDTVQYVC